jgi:predicted  nucleic acid-binding Zn-ribbon protein
MLGKKKKPTLNDRMTDIESYLDQISDTLEDMIKRIECLEVELDDIKADKTQIEAEVKIMKPRLGLPV